jgi:hypothetical protein
LGKAAEEIAQLYAWLRRQLDPSLARLPAIRQHGNKVSRKREVV